MMDEPQQAAEPETERRTGEASPFLLGSSTAGPTQNSVAGENLRAGLRLVTYVACASFVVYLTMWFGTSLFREPVVGQAALWQEMYVQAALALGVLLPGLMMARIEGTDPDVYGLPRAQAFGKKFWMGAVWGLASITALLLLLRGVHAFYFGQVVLHGVRALRFAAFWGMFFLLVGLTEEFAMRGYTQYTLARKMGFWPAACVMSLVFAVIHLRNPGETWVGLAGVVAIGLFFCLTLYRTGSLWFAVGFHAFWDWGQTYLYSVPDSGTVEVGHLMRSSFHGPDWLTGGSVGPEGSVLCFAVIAAVSAVFAWRYRGVRHTTVAKKENSHASGT